MYRRFTRFLLPLVLTIVIQEFGGQVLNAGMARMPEAIRVLAAFGLAWGLVLLLTSPLAQTRHVGLVLVASRQDFAKGLRFVVSLALVMVAVQLVMGAKPVGVWVIEGLHRIDPETGAMVRTALRWLLPVPLLRGITQYCVGVLTRARCTGAVSNATASSVVAGLLVVLVLLSVDAVRARPIWLPILATYAAVAVELVVTVVSLRRSVSLPNASDAPRLAPPSLTYGEIVRFFWPLALVMTVQEFSRPLINLFVARGSGGAQALAVLTVAYALGQWPYRWLNEVRNLLPAFYDEVKALAPFRRYALLCGLTSFGISLLLFWTPLRPVILRQFIGLDAELAALTRTPLQLYAFFSFVVMVRTHFHGIAFIERRTRAMAPSAPMRIVAIVTALLVLPFFGVEGATRGVAALLAGFSAETLTVWFGLRGLARVRGWRRERWGVVG